MQADSDDYNRWDASQRLCLNAIKSESIANPKLIAAFERLLKDSTLNPALLGQMLNLPSFQFIAEESDTVEVQKILNARNRFIDAFCQALKEPLFEVYSRYQREDDEKFTGKMQENRFLKNICLAHLVRSQDPRSLELVQSQYQNSHNMTNLLGALSAINHTANPLREQLFADYYQKWQDDVLLVNKWLSLQALSELPNALDTIQALLSHRSFDIKNPNKVYALISTFGSSNAERFHNSQGRGYDFLAERIMEIDPFNPQVAARLLESLTSWKRLDSEHGQRMKSALLKIQAGGTLSEDSFEIVTKTLQ
jgi:aminopeptidase N